MSVLELSFESKEESVEVRRFAVHEAMSTLFDVSVVARSPNDDIDLESIVGKGAAFTMVGGLQLPRVWTGIVSDTEQIQVEEPLGHTPGLSTYFLRIVPQVWLLT